MPRHRVSVANRDAAYTLQQTIAYPRRSELVREAVFLRAQAHRPRQQVGSYKVRIYFCSAFDFDLGAPSNHAGRNQCRITGMPSTSEGPSGGAQTFWLLLAGPAFRAFAKSDPL